MEAILVDFSLDLRGARSVSYAACFARVLQAKLVIRMPEGEDADALFASFKERFGVHLDPAEVVRDGQPLVANLAKDRSLCYVSHRSIEEAQSRAPKGAHVLLSMDEGGALRPLDLRCICLPFGNRSSGLMAAHVAISLAHKLDAEICAVHTTYPNPHVQSESPEAHMDADARRIQASIQELAACREVATQFHIVVEAPDVPGFSIQAATDFECGLIVVARGDLALAGSNAELIAMQSHMPVLFVNPHAAGGKPS